MYVFCKIFQIPLKDWEITIRHPALVTHTLEYEYRVRV